MTLAAMLADLPMGCAVGTKRNAKGYKTSWIGYKLHIDTADGDIPVSCLLTSASVHDSQVALPLAVLFERHSAQVFRIARAILHDDGEAEETVQKVFLDIFRAVNQFNPDRGTLKTWLLQYAYHRSIDRRQHLQSNRFYSRDELDELMPAELFRGAGHLLCLLPQEVVCLVEQVLATP